MKKKRAGSLGRRLARWMALLTLAGLALTCLGVYTVTALSFQDRQNDTLRQQKIQVSHLIAEVGGPDFTTLTHKLDDAMVGRRDVRMTLTGPNGRVIYASGNIPSDKRTIDARFEISNSNGSIQALLSLDASEDDRVLKRLAQTLIAAALAGAVVIAIGGYTLVQIGLEPVRDL